MIKNLAAFRRFLWFYDVLYYFPPYGRKVIHWKRSFHVDLLIDNADFRLRTLMFGSELEKFQSPNYKKFAVECVSNDINV